MEKWETLESSYLFTNHFANIRQDRVRLPNGKTIDGYIVNEYPEWVNVVAITTDNQVVLVRQYRHGFGDFFIEIPGGTVQPGEAPDSTAVRELCEETGFRSHEPPILIGDFYTNPAIATNQIKTFLVMNAQKESEPEPDDTEDLECLVVPCEQLEEMIRSGEIKQMFTVAALCLAKEHLRKR